MNQFLAIVLTLFTCFTGVAAASVPPSFKKVFIIVFENTKYQNALEDPYFSKLTKSGALFTNLHGETHPSQPNYIAMVAGDTMGVKDDANVTIEGKHIGDLLEEKNKTWKAYVEGYPGNCYLGRFTGKYVRKHTPFLSFSNVQKNIERCRRVENASELAGEIENGTLPDFSFYVPDQYNDGHDTDIKFSSHYSVLRMIEDVFGLGTLGRGDAKATAITGIWR